MIDYEEDWIISLLFKSGGNVGRRASLYAVPSALLSVGLMYLDVWIPEQRKRWGILDLEKSQLWAAATGVMFVLLFFRCRLAWGRFWEGTGLLHQMRGEWFDTVSNCVSFSLSARKGKMKEVDEFRHTIVRVMSLCHSCALEEISGDEIQLESIDTFGLSDDVLAHVQDCSINCKFNKVEVMLHLLQSLITTAHEDGILKIPPPILSRVYQTASRGFVNLLNAKKIQDTKFPFPFAQIIAVLLLANTLLIPMMMATVINSKIACGFFTFFPVWGAYCLNFISQQLENPFGTDANDLPLETFQTEMNNCLMMLLHPNADLIPTISSRCEMNFHKLRTTHRMSRKHTDDKHEAPVEEEKKHQRGRTKRLSDFSAAKVAEEIAAMEAMGGLDSDVFDSRMSQYGTESYIGSEASLVASQRFTGVTSASVEAMSPKVSHKVTSSVDTMSSKMSHKALVSIDNMSPKTSHKSAKTLSVKFDPAITHDPTIAHDPKPETHMNIDFEIAYEPGWDERNLPREGTPLKVMSPTVWSPTASDSPRMLSTTTADLVRSLKSWAQDMDNHVDNLSTDSHALRQAMEQFGDAITVLERKAHGSPMASQVL